VISDLRHALRSLAGNPGFFAAAVGTLALGIGANAVMFTAVSAVLLRPLPYPHPEQLVKLSEMWRGAPNAIAPANFLDWQRRSHSFDAMAAFVPDAMNLSDVSEAERVPAARVSPNFFDLLGVKPVVGRLFAPDDDTPGRQDVVVVRASFWQTTLGGDPHVVGRMLTLDGDRYQIAGVVPDSVDQPTDKTGIWRPLVVPPAQKVVRGAHYLFAIGRVKSTVTVAQADEELVAIGEALRRENPVTNERVGAGAIRLDLDGVRDTRRPLWLLFGATGVVLLIACVNVAHLLLARGSGRRTELAIRTALGASRGRLVRQLATESLLLALAGGAAGLFLAMWGVVAIRAAVPETLAAVGRARVDGQVLGFTMALAAATSLLFGTFPALRLSAVSLETVMRTGSRTSTSRRAAGRVVITLQVALAVVLVVGAALLGESLLKTLRVNPGFDTDDLAVARIVLPGKSYDTGERQRQFFRQLIERVTAVPGVQGAAVATRMPLRPQAGNMTFTVDTTPPKALDGVVVQEISPDYFRVLRLPILQGRPLTEDDAARFTSAMVSRRFARQTWGTDEVIGRRFRMGPTYITEGNPWMEVVGVVEDVRQVHLAARPSPQVYLPYSHTVWAPTELAVRASIDPGVVFGAIRSAVRDLDRNLPVTALYTMRDVIDRSVSGSRFNTLLVGLFAALALVLALVGIHGVIAYSVGQRLTEIGIRVALGARRADVLRLIGGEGLVLVAAGLVAGLAGAALASRALEGMLYGVTRLDPWTYAATGLSILATATAACLIPTLRATRVDPASVLRQ